MRAPGVRNLLPARSFPRGPEGRPRGSEERGQEVWQILHIEFLLWSLEECLEVKLFG